MCRLHLATCFAVGLLGLISACSASSPGSASLRVGGSTGTTTTGTTPPPVNITLNKATCSDVRARCEQPNATRELCTAANYAACNICIASPPDMCTTSGQPASSAFTCDAFGNPCHVCTAASTTPSSERCAIIDSSCDAALCGSTCATCTQNQYCDGTQCQACSSSNDANIISCLVSYVPNRPATRPCEYGNPNNPPIKCFQKCVNKSNDASNCGGCGTVCSSATPNCINGTCSACPTGQVLCNGVCADLTKDPLNCGKCGTTCTSGQICAGSTCTSCPAATPTVCNNTCVFGLCCPSGQTFCQGSCLDTSTDNNNCGSCGHMCPYPQICNGGTCKL